MSLRSQVMGVLLPVIKEQYPGAEAADFGFFGKKADISAPLPAKYGVDLRPDAVYNIGYDTVSGSVPLFSGISSEGGFADLNFSEAALEAFADEAISAGIIETPCERIALGRTAEAIHARLLTAAECLSEGGFRAPASRAARSAFVQLLAADSPSSLNVALEAAEAALDAHRRRPVFCKKALLAMAAALSRSIEIKSLPYNGNALTYKH